MKKVQKTTYRLAIQFAVPLFLLFALSGLQSCKKSEVKEKDNIKEPPKNEETITIKSILDKGQGTSIEKNAKIVGVVISSKNSEVDGGVLIQDNTGSIFLDIGNHDFNSNDVVSVSVGEKSMRTIGNRAQIEGVKKDHVFKVSDNIVLAAKSMLIQDIVDKVNNTDDQKLVKLTNVEIVLLNDHEGDKSFRLRDATGSVKLSVPVKFESDLVYNGASVVGYYRYLDEKPVFFIRSAEDISEDGEAIAELTTIVETFEDPNPRKGTYPVGSTEFKSGIWTLDGALIHDKEPMDYRPWAPRLIGANGKDAALPGPGFIQPTFTFENLNRITVEFVGHGNQKPSTDKPPFIVEIMISTDEGESWQSLGTATNQSYTVVSTVSFLIDDSLKDKELMVRVVNMSSFSETLTRGNRININSVLFEFDQ